DDVEWLPAGLPQRGQRSERRPDTNFDLLLEPRPPQVLPRHLRVAGIELQRHDAPVRRQRAPHPDRAVAPERAELEHPPRSVDAQQQIQEAALAGGDRDLRQARPRARGEGLVQDRIVPDQHPLGEVVDGLPELLAHALAARLISASGTASPASRPSVTMRRPGWTASRGRPAPGIAVAAPSTSSASSARPQRRAGPPAPPF